MNVPSREDLVRLYRLMVLSRRVEEALGLLWDQGLISGELHQGTGEEAIIAAVIDHLRDGDALALDHRATAPMVMRGVPLDALFAECLGRAEGLGRGRAGHMHLMDSEKRMAASGIVGSAGPMGSGFALAARYRRPGTIAVAFHGEAAVNQGMLMESFNLAAAWELPLLFVCRDDDRAITTRSSTTTGGDVDQRVRSFGLPVFSGDGRDVSAAWSLAGDAVARARQGTPSFLRLTCVHLDGHYKGDALFRLARNPVKEMVKIGGGITKSFLRGSGAPPSDRIEAVASLIRAAARTPRGADFQKNDPVAILRNELVRQGIDPTRIKEMEDAAEGEIRATVSAL